MKTTSNAALLNLSVIPGGRHRRRARLKPASCDSGSRLESMFLAEMAARRERLKKWMTLIEREIRREEQAEKRCRKTK